jgi:hypothetical protein
MNCSVSNNAKQNILSFEWDASVSLKDRLVSLLRYHIWVRNEPVQLRFSKTTVARTPSFGLVLCKKNSKNASDNLNQRMRRGLRADRYPMGLRRTSM